VISIRLRCAPPTKTSQGKRARIVKGKNGKLIPVFFKKAATSKELDDWRWLVRPYRPAVPIADAVVFECVLVYPYLADTSKRDRARGWLPKISKPDCDNAMKGFVDVLVDEQFLVDDQRIARFVVEKYHGPDADVGIYLTIGAWGGVDAGTGTTVEAVRLAGATRQVERPRGAGPGHAGAV